MRTFSHLHPRKSLSLSLSIGFHLVKLELLRLKTNLKKIKTIKENVLFLGFIV